MVRQGWLGVNVKRDEKKAARYGVEMETDSEQEKKSSLGYWEAEKERLDYLQKFVVGNVEKLCNVDIVDNFVSSNWGGNSEVKLIGGRNILIKFETEEELRKVLDNTFLGKKLEKIVKRIPPGRATNVIENRRSTTSDLA